MAITYALLDPLMTIARPIAAMTTATVAGLAENFLDASSKGTSTEPDLSCPVDGCCDGDDCPPEEHKRHHSLSEKLAAGAKFAITEVWEDIANWFLLGLILAGLITVIIPEGVITRYLGGGLHSMLVMLVIGIPLYICATASTPIAAALILKGISPGAALVFLLAGPATNITSLTVLLGTLGKKATFIYLGALSVITVLFGLMIDFTYQSLGLSIQVTLGKASEIIPHWAQWIGAILLLLLSIRPLSRVLKSTFRVKKREEIQKVDPMDVNQAAAGCSGST